MADIFVSYAREDRTRVQSLAAALQQAGWTVWWDREILAGSEFEQVIQTELDRASCVVVAWSATSVASPWVRNEANEGLKRRVLLPIILDDSAPPLAFRHIQSVSFANESSVDVDSPAFMELRRALANLVGLPVAEDNRSPREHAASGINPSEPTPAHARRFPWLMVAAAAVIVGLLGGYLSFFKDRVTPTPEGNTTPVVDKPKDDSVPPPVGDRSDKSQRRDPPVDNAIRLSIIR